MATVTPHSVLNLQNNSNKTDIQGLWGTSTMQPHCKVPPLSDKAFVSIIMWGGPAWCGEFIYQQRRLYVSAFF